VGLKPPPGRLSTIPDRCLSFVFRMLREQQFSWVVPEKHLYFSIPTTQILWTISIVLKKCFVSQSVSPREISPSPMTHCRCSGSTCHFIALTARSTSTAGASSTTRHYRLSRSTSREFFSLSLAMAQFSKSMTTSFAPPQSTSFATSWRSATDISSGS
jgi:hypothetical protein